MGLSLSVLAALCFLLPGFAFVLGVSRLHNPKSPPTPLDRHFSVGLLAALVAALFLHGVWFSLVQHVAERFFLPAPSVSQFVALLAGSVEKDPSFPSAVDSLNDYPLRISAYFFSIIVGAWVAGRACNRFIQRTPDASWYKLLKPEGPDFVWLTLEVDMDSSCFLIAGVVTEFSVDTAGSLERVVLEHAMKRPLHPPPVPKWKAPTNPWIEIPGEFMVLLMRETRTVNVDYHYLPDDTVELEHDTTR